jgi:hypothetical protein
MLKLLPELVAFALLGTAIMALPGFAITVEARETAVLAKGDRLQVRDAPCSAQVWPDFTSSCLRIAGSGARIPEARQVASRR